MPIVVEHSGNLPTIGAAIQLLLAQRQQQDQQQSQQGNVQDALSQLAPILAARHAASQGDQTGSYAIPQGGPPIDPNAIPPDQSRYIRPTIQQQPADHSSSVLRGLLGDHQADERMQNQDQLAQFKAQQSDQRLGERNQQQNDIEQLRSSDMLVRQAHQPLPQQIVMGLQSGHMAYSPIQNKQLQDFDTWDAQLDSDPTFSDAQKARGHADIAMKRRQVQLSPQSLTPDKWPVTPEQQLQQSIVMRPTTLDDGTVVQIPTVPVQRAGGVKWEPTPDGDLAMKVAMHGVEQRGRERLAQMNNANKPDAFIAQQQKQLQAQQHAALDSLKQRKPTEKQFIEDKPDPDPKHPGQTIPVVNYQRFSAARDEWDRQYDAASRQQFAPTLDGVANQHDAFDAMAAHAGIPGASSQQPTQPPTAQSTDSPPPQTAPSDAGGGQQLPPPAPPLSDHPEDGPSQWGSLAVGEVTTLPDGRTVRKTGDQSFEPVQ